MARRTRALALFPMGLALLLGACASGTARGPARPLAEVPAGIPAPTVRVETPALPSLETTVLDPGEDGLAGLDELFAGAPPVTLNVEDAPLEEVLRVLSEASGRSLVLAPGIDTRVSASFHEAPIPRILRVLLGDRGLGVRAEGNLVRVVPAPLSTVAFHLSLPDLANAGDEGAAAGGPSSTTWKTIDEAVHLVLSPRGEVHLDPEGSLLIVRDVPARIDRVRKVLEETIAPRRRQVTIEASILEVALDDGLSYGIDWSAPDLLATISGSRVTGAFATRLVQDEGVVTFSIDSHKLSALFKALRERGQLEVLSAPRLTTLNRVPARIAITEEIPYYTSDFSAVGQEPIQSIQVEFREAGVVLEVTPIVASTGEVTLLLHPKVTELTGWTPALPNLPPNPILDVREVTTTVRATHGQSVVLAGLIRNRFHEQGREVPGLGQAPGIGAAFRNISQTAERTELVIVITPVVTNADWQRRAVEKGLGDIEKLRRPFTPGPVRGILRGRVP